MLPWILVFFCKDDIQIWAAFQLANESMNENADFCSKQSFFHKCCKHFHLDLLDEIEYVPSIFPYRSKTFDIYNSCRIENIKIRNNFVFARC